MVIQQQGTPTCMTGLTPCEPKRSYTCISEVMKTPISSDNRGYTGKHISHGQLSCSVTVCTSAMPLTKKFAARDRSDKMTKIVGCIRWRTTSSTKSHPIGLNFRCWRFSVTIVCIFRPVEYSRRFLSSCLTGHVLQTFW
ncbi:hypothetical protein AVEN_7933-1 [Araneus ventricosus]|uniref:Uncharacterized protein n=1 Tax=Araneus ventricosus TaxID=182803 RepID=A0A4Y2D1M7_ARAVE|nr:hypothetical protein AVEN_7933-1 [Araneus ventricosus]